MAIIFAGKQMQFTREHNDRAWHAWHVAYLPNTKRRVPLQKLLIKDRTAPRSPERQMEMWKQWVLSVGGKIEGKPN